MTPALSTAPKNWRNAGATDEDFLPDGFTRNLREEGSVSTENESCDSCGAVPAMPVEFTALAHFLVYLRIERDRGVRCRECALALYRRQVSMTLALGWWGLGALGVPLCIGHNRRALARVRRLGPVQSAGESTARFAVGPDGSTTDAGALKRHGRPLDAGRPLRKRISTYSVFYALILLTVAVFIIRGSN
jgi:hypothetical protein